MNKKIIIIIFSIIIVIALVIGALLMLNNNNTNTSDRADINNNNTGNTNYNELSFITDLNSVPQEKWNELYLGSPYKDVLKIRYEDEIGVVHGKLTLQQKEYTINARLEGGEITDKNLYTITVNTNGWFYPKSINSALANKNNSIDIFVLDTDFNLDEIDLKYRVLSKGEKTLQDLYNKNNAKTIESDGWRLVIYENINKSVIYYPLFTAGNGEHTYLEGTINVANREEIISEKNWEKFLNEFSKNITIKKVDNLDSDSTITLSKDFQPIKLSDKYSLNMSNNIYLKLWQIGPSTAGYQNYVKLQSTDEKHGIEIYENREGVTLEEYKNQLMKDEYYKYKFVSYKYKDIELELFSGNLGFKGFLIEIDNILYEIRCSNSSNYTNQNQIIEFLDYIFSNVLIATK